MIIIILLAFSLNACNDFLDVNPDRRTQIDSRDKIRKTLVSGYTRSSFSLLTELSSDNIDDLGDHVNWHPNDFNMFYWKDVNGTAQDSPQYFWEGCYGAIANINAALEAIKNSKNPESYNAEKGEALVSRAYHHFMLVNVFGLHYNKETSKTDLGVVYMEGSEKTLDPKYKRESVEEIYKKIDKDLEEGLPLIDNSIYKVQGYHFSKSAAYAFAARFNLYYEKWEKAEQYASMVVGENPVSVLKNWEELGSGKYEQYDETPAEYMSNKRQSNLLVGDMNSLRTRKFYWNGKRNIRFHHHGLVAETETIKVSSFYGQGNRNFHMPIFTSVTPYNNTTFFNIPEFFEYTDPVARIGYVHTGEVFFTTDESLLVRAEAKVMQKKFDTAAEDLNIWVNNFCKSKIDINVEMVNNFYNGIEYYTYESPTQKKKLNPKFTVETGTQENLIHAILQARRVLTLHEGLRWFDIKRYGIEISRRYMGDNGSKILEHKDYLTKDDPRRAIQLPLDVINAGLEANPRNK